MSNIFLESINSNDSPYSLNDTGDLTRLAYSNKNSDIPLRNSSMTDRFESDTFINQKESFEENNSRINSLNDEIRELKNKLKLVYEKDDEIQKLKNELSQYELKLKDSESQCNDNIRLRNENDSLKRELDMLKITGLEVDKYKSENILLKKKLIELSKKEESKEDIQDLIDESDSVDPIETVSVDVTRIKSVLYNRLKSYHENHIDKLILQYDLNKKTEIEKELMEKILLEAIHV
tara:strand:- start:1306 stop:2010 length:705 start_codon:yes stop_codon:yes gene_type:complete